MCSRSILPFLRPAAAAIATLVFIAGLSPRTARGEIDPAARELATAVAEKLGAARTIRLTAKHSIDPALELGLEPGKGRITVTFQRPNQFHAVSEARNERREIAYDGKELCLIYPDAKLHALEPVKAPTIERLADLAAEKFGFRPPLAELLANDLPAQLFANATSATVEGIERVGWTRCQRLRIEQEGMTGDLWVGAKDHLPRRLLLTFPTLPDQPTWDIRFSKWELDVPVDAAAFSKRPGADSHRVRLLKSR